MTIDGLRFVNNIIRDVKRRSTTITYLRPTADKRKHATTVAFSDAGFTHRGEEKGTAKEGFVLGLAFGDSKRSKFHTFQWQSQKQRRVATSSTVSEVIAANSAVAIAVHLQKVSHIFMRVKFPIKLVID